MSTEFWRGRKIPTGSGSGLNADLLDGHDTSYFEPADATILKQADVDDTPVDGVTTAPVSSNWAYDHAAATQAHGISQFGSTLVDDSDASTARSTLGLGTAAVAASGDFATANHTHATYALNAGATHVGGDSSNYVNVAADGTLTLVGTATAWDDLMIPGHAVKLTGNSPPDLAGGFAGDATLDLYVFDGGSTLEQVFFTVQMPHRWKQGSTIYPHVHFSPTSTNTGDTNERVVRFSLEYTWANINDTFGATNTLPLDSDPFVPNTSQWKHLLAKNATGIDGTGKTLSSMLVCRLFRDPTDNADTYPQDAAFLQFDIHYEIDAFGSSSEYTK